MLCARRGFQSEGAAVLSCRKKNPIIYMTDMEDSHNKGRQAGALLVPRDAFIKAVRDELIDQFQGTSVQGLVELEAESIARYPASEAIRLPLDRICGPPRRVERCRGRTSKGFLLCVVYRDLCNTPRTHPG